MKTAKFRERLGPIVDSEKIRPNSSLPFAMLAIATILPGCATTPAVQGTRLSSYEGLSPSDGKLTKSKLMIRKEQVLAAKTINISPTIFPSTIAPKLSGGQRVLVSNTVDRALCISLSDRFRVVLPTEPADLTVRATVTKATETDEVAAGVSAIGSLSTSFIDMGTNVPIPIPRIPYGLGDLSIEAEAIDASGRQQAAMLWGRGAGVLFSSPRASKASDVYELASAFGDDFGNLLVKGETPFKSMNINIPSWQKINSNIGLAPKYAACETYGRSPGLVGMAGAKIGLPPEWTDNGPRASVRP
ncbi:DUF3313 domain-containing protein [Tardiphaga sp. 172_B4_N1_3]|uniref:DUF3313 domain-containing protein n=1 Tax=Tardiphaga sp. 172_B4_N1_3 TaxID=3240787 RepID=UPI003F8B563E